MSAKANALIWGAGGHALVIADLLAQSDTFQLAAVLLDPEWQHTCRPGLHYLLRGGIDACSRLRDEGVTHAVVAVGDNMVRDAIAARLEAMGMSLLTIVHPTAYVSPSATLGAGTVVAPGAVVNAGVSIGRNCIVNSGAIIEHESIVEEAVHISPGAKIAGQVGIGRATWIGIGATVIEKVRIGRNSVIGAGAVVVSDLPDEIVAYGVPARICRQNETKK